MRIAVLSRERCQPKKCSQECYKFCPIVRTGEECIVFEDFPVISEVLCSGCGICIKKCPYQAIKIIGLPSELEENLVHRYGINAFALYGLFVPSPAKVTGILGPNGTGKTTILRILAGDLQPNLGKDASWEDLMRKFSGTQVQDYLRKIRDGRLKVSMKPQSLVLDEIDFDRELASKLEIDPGKRKEKMSGGELQRAAIASCLSKDADLYFFDEVTPYLDIYQRMKVAKLISEIASLGKTVVVVEHDLAILDYLADIVHITYGVPGAYGMVTGPKTPRTGINEYLEGFLSEENIRIRNESISFETPLPQEKEFPVLFNYGSFSKRYRNFYLKVSPGDIREAEVLGVVGPNAIGKSTYARILAGVIPPSSGDVRLNVKISYKPQYIYADEDVKVCDLLKKITPEFGKSHYRTELLLPLQLEELLERSILELSGGELQRVAIAACLSRDASLYILDEPSAHLDVEQRILAIKAIRRHTKNKGSAALIIDHDIYLIDLLSDRLSVFSGTPGRKGIADGPFNLRDGMNLFLKSLGITFRRDRSGRPRINKPGSRKDREQKSSGEYYYPEPE